MCILISVSCQWSSSPPPSDYNGPPTVLRASFSHSGLHDSLNGDCAPRFPDCDEPYPRAEDLLRGSDPTNQSSTTVQRDYGFWCPRELKVDPDLGYTFMGKKDCSAPCPSMFFSQQELTFIRYFVGVVSVVCLSATLFTFLTFLIDVTRCVTDA